ncbi:signal peptidase I [Bacteroides helcogenes]|uniref:Signal peptidase I n=1 Tax=Bacteroides helcogenes (strain ATCC 35417 / DSM 20613 / JCM 6297 / CCUG 15421 / P 36-108) TaxID=693979 RepID=E6SUJ0_BACT6|nr:signal peptidase I [Bacteroides helcogenes]ADV43354.1 signal peptidase I [Bacteroides helcogenes P 36-108]MDY5238122.1 signal peptidase I [Bacteroides helcogenes]
MKEDKQLSKWLNRITDMLFYLCLVIVILMVLQVFVVTSFKIPSDSMQPSLFPGDCILVDKCSGGARLFNVFDAVDRKEVDIHRVPGWRKFRRNDVLVFNFPYQPQRWDSVAFDVMKYYVKRCVAVPGDTLEIRKGYYKVSGYDEGVGCLSAQKDIALLPDSGVTGMVMNTFPWNQRLGWTVKEFGPLPVPAKGQIVKMDSLAWLLYRQLVGWEQKSRLRIDGTGNVLLNDSVIHEYRFRENYYFVAGDKAGNSQDSRYWGLLPESFIVGRAWMVWKSVEPESGKVRWKRVFKHIL